MISIVIPLYNKEKFIDSTIESILTQTYQQFEIIIIDDGSTDASIDIIRKKNDNRIRLFQQKNQGVSAARNKGIQEAVYDYIAFLDADDAWDNDFLATTVDLINNYPDCSIFACAYRFIDKKNNVINLILKKLTFNNDSGVLSNYFEVASCSHPPLCASAITVKKESMLCVGGFPLDSKSGEDLLTWAKLAINYKIAYYKKAKASYFFDLEEFNKNPRKLESNDIVGNQLTELLKRNPKIKGLKKYVAFWHKTRMSIMLRYASWFHICIEGFISLRYNPFEIRILIYTIIALFPIKYRLKFFKYSSMGT